MMREPLERVRNVGSRMQVCVQSLRFSCVEQSFVVPRKRKLVLGGCHLYKR